MPADSLAEKMLMKLLLQNNLVTKTQLKRVVSTNSGLSDKTLPDILLEKRLVDPEKMNKILDVIEKKNVLFPLMNSHATSKSHRIKMADNS